MSQGPPIHPVIPLAVFALLLLVPGCLGGFMGGLPPPPQGYRVSGIVVDGNGVGIGGVTILYHGQTSGSATSRTDGSWDLIGLEGVVTIDPEFDGWSFSPATETVEYTTHGIMFIGTPDFITVTGRIVDSSGNGLRGALVSIGTSSTFSGPSDPLTPGVPSQEEGSFSLVAQTGLRMLVVNKPGFETRSDWVTIQPTGSLQSCSLGNIELTKDPPPDLGDYTDSRVRVPGFDADGKAYLTVPAPSSTSVSWIALFATADSSSGYTFGSTPIARSATSWRRESTSSIGTVSGQVALSRGFGANRSGLDHETQTQLRESEAEAFELRDYILGAQHRTRLGIEDEEGQKRSFFVSRSGVYESIEAECLALGSWSAVYADVTSGVSPLVASELASAFDNMRPALTQAFGIELDVDSNQRVAILLTPLSSSSGTLYGYFSWVNELPYSVAMSRGHRSNECDMIYVNSDIIGFDLGTLGTAKATIAHEYQHLLHFSERIRNGNQIDRTQDTWINEGFSVLAQDIAGYGYLDRDPLSTAFVEGWLENHTTWSLISWESNDASYGGSYLFARYLYDCYGGGATLGINRSAYGGMQAVTDAVGDEFNDVFRSFVASIPYAVHRSTSPDPRLGFTAALDLGEGPDGTIMYATESYNESRDALPPFGVEFFFMIGGESNTEVSVILDTDALGDYGAVVVEGFSR